MIWDLIWYDMIYDTIYDLIWYDMIWYVIDMMCDVTCGVAWRGVTWHDNENENDNDILYQTVSVIYYMIYIITVW